VDTDSHDGAGRPSKTQKKREMSALQDLGTALVELPAERLAKIGLPEALHLAVRDAQRFTAHEARRRQLQYIGRLMRETDPAPIQAALDAMRGVSAAAIAAQHRLERLRARLLEDEQVLGEIAAAHPGADMQQLRQLRRNALREQQTDKPPRAYRELFRLLRDIEAGAPPENRDGDDE